MKVSFWIFVINLLLIGCCMSYCQEVWDIAIPLPNDNYERISYLNLEKTGEKTGGNIISNSFFKYIKWDVVESLSKKLDIKELIYAEIIHRRINGRDIAEYKNVDLLRGNTSNDKAKLEFELDRIWVVRYEPVSEWSRRILPDHNIHENNYGILNIPGSENKDGSKKYFAVWEGTIIVTSDLKTLKKVQGSFLEGDSIIYSDKYYFVKEFFEHYPHYWSFTNIKDQLDAGLLMGKLLKYKPEDLDAKRKLAETIIASMYYLDFKESIEVGIGTIFSSPKLAKEYLPKWEEHPREFKSNITGAGKLMSNAKPGRVSNSNVQYFNLPYERFHVESRLKKASEEKKPKKKREEQEKGKTTNEEKTP